MTNDKELTEEECDEFRDMLESGAHRISRKQRHRSQIIAGALALTLIGTVAGGVAVAALRAPAPITATPSVSPTIDTPTPIATPIPTSTPSSAPEQPESAPPVTPPSAGVDTDALISQCVEMASENFMGSRNGMLTIHYEDVLVGPSRAPYWVVYLPATDASPELAINELAMICSFDPAGSAPAGYGGSIRYTESQITELFNGTGEYWIDPGH